MQTKGAALLALKPITLASGSAIRAELLKGAGVSFTVLRPDVDEDRLKDHELAAGLSPKAVALELARAKAHEVARRESGLILGADQVLQIDNDLISKSGDFATARKLLLRLSGQTHYLHCAAVLAEGPDIVFSTVETVELTMRRFDEAFVDTYLEAAGPEILKSVGAYQMEGLGLHLFEQVRGDYFTVLGLPMFSLMKALRRLEVVRT